MPLRIYDISKKLGLENKLIIAKAKALGIAAAKVPSSSLDRQTAEYLEVELLKDLGIQPKRGLLSFGLAHFKAFAEDQNIPVRPLTLIFGANSSGKSSIIHGMLLAREAVETGKVDIFKTELGGDSVDLGGFRQYVHRRRVGERVQWSAELETRNLSGNAYAVFNRFQQVKVTLYFGIPLDDKGYPQKNQPPRLVQYDIESGGRMILRLVKREDGNMQIVGFDNPAFLPIVTAFLMAQSSAASVFSDTDRNAIEKAINDLWPQLHFECKGLLPGALFGQKYQYSSSGRFFPLSKGDRQTQLSESVPMFFPGALLEVIKGINNEVQTRLQSLVYLGPLRSYPPRHLAFSEDNDRNWFAGGGYAWDLVRTDTNLRESVNGWLSSHDRLKTPYQLEIEKFYAASEIQVSLSKGINKVATDVIARIMGDVKSDDDETTRLLGIRDEIELNRFNLEKRLKELRDELKQNDALINQQKASESKLASHLERTRIQLELVAQQGAAQSGQQAQTKEQLEDSFSTLKTVLEGFKETSQSFIKEREDLIVENTKLEEQLKALQRKKEEIFSAITSNIDSEQFVKWLYDEIQDRPERTAVDELVLRDCRTDTRVSHRDVGIGVSQVLPVLVHAFADVEKIVAIEQPEIHLHPKMQAELGDLFIESALGERKNTFLLETHSEHLILRILRRVRETTEKRLPKGMEPIKPEDISVIYVEPTPSGSIVKHLTVTPDGDFAEPWPGGFFAERLEDLP
jgi:AAA15 family ATPase/GTPase